MSAIPLTSAPDIPVKETVAVHGYQIRIADIGPGASTVVWDTGDWQVSVILEGPDGTSTVSRAEFQRFLYGLAWS